MAGSLQIKKNMYYIVISFTENGKRKQKWIKTGLPAKGNKRKAEQLLKDVLNQAEQDQAETKEETPTGAPEPLLADALFSDCIRSWLSVSKRRVDEVTYQWYKLLADRHILPYFDSNKIKLRDVTRQVLQTYIDEKAAGGRADGKEGGLSPRSLRLHKNILNQSLVEAVKAEAIPSNPCQYVDLPSITRYESKFYTAEQMRALFDAIQNDPIFPMVKITSIYGLRRSELLGLKWDSVNFGSGTITIKHTVSKVSKAVEKDKTKNASSYRTFPLLPEARSIFLDAKAQEDENRRLFAGSYVSNDYIFKWPDGRPYSPDYITRHFSALLKQHNLPHIRFHELRHPYVKYTTKKYPAKAEIPNYQSIDSLGSLLLIYCLSI